MLGRLLRIFRHDPLDEPYEGVEAAVLSLPEQTTTQLPADVDLIRAQGDKASERATLEHIKRKRQPS